MSADLAADEVAFHRTAVERGRPVPRGVACEIPADPLATPFRLPTVVKEARGEWYAGRHFVTDRDDLTVLSAGLRYPVLARRP